MEFNIKTIGLLILYIIFSADFLSSESPYFVVRTSLQLIFTTIGAIYILLTSTDTSMKAIAVSMIIVNIITMLLVFIFPKLNITLFKKRRLK